MFNHSLLTTLRALRRRPAYTAINITGLAVGIACVGLIALFIWHEWSYERFHGNADRIVRMSVDMYQEGERRPNVSTQGILAPALEEHLPEVARTVRLTQGPTVLRVGGDLFKVDGSAYADPDLFMMFDGWTVVRGDRASMLEGPNQLVVTERLAERYFGDADPIGQIVHSNQTALTVTGVVGNPPSNTHLDLNAFVSLSTVEDPGWWYTNWHSVNFLTYVLLEKSATVEGFRAKLPAFIKAVAGEAMKAMNEPIVLAAEPLTDLHLFSEYDRAGSFKQLLAFGVIALFVLLVACLNFINLATARSAERAQEVGVRKTLGSGHGQLVARFLTESVAITALAGVLALGIVRVAMPAFGQMTDSTLAFDPIAAWVSGWILLVGLTGVLAGAYPAFVLSSVKPTTVLSGSLSGSSSRSWLRRGLVVTQLAITIGLIAATGIIYSQLQFMQTQSLGFDPGSADTGELLTLHFGGEDELNGRLASLKQKIQQHPSVIGVSSSITVPTGGTPMAGGMVEAPGGRQRDMSVEAFLVDTAFVDVYDVNVIAGMPPGAATMSEGVIALVLNETAMRQAGYAAPDSILDANAQFWGMSGEVVGVVQDFHVRGLQHAVRPLALVVTDQFQQYLTVRVARENLSETLADLGGIWADMVPQRPFDYIFLNEAFGAQYEAEQRFGKLFAGFAGLAILIACLGLLGLVAYSAEQRTKEIGIRKVLGASQRSVVLLLTREVVVLAVVAFAVATPVAIWGMSEWLNTFAHRTDIGAGVVLGAGLLAVIVAGGTAGLQAWRAARLDPVNALRAD
jgi:putative ABC transport system permease protein